jgi:hypothetical protein
MAAPVGSEEPLSTDAGAEQLFAAVGTVTFWHLARTTGLGTQVASEVDQ